MMPATHWASACDLPNARRGVGVHARGSPRGDAATPSEVAPDERSADDEKGDGNEEAGRTPDERSKCDYDRAGGVVKIAVTAGLARPGTSVANCAARSLARRWVAEAGTLYVPVRGEAFVPVAEAVSTAILMTSSIA